MTKKKKDSCALGKPRTLPGYAKLIWAKDDGSPGKLVAAAKFVEVRYWQPINQRKTS